MRGRCFNAQALIEDDLLCFFRFSGKKVLLVGDLGKKADSEGASSSLGKGKRKAAAEGGERRKKRHHGKTTKSAREAISKSPINEPLGTKGTAPEQQSTEEPYVLLDTSAISFVAKPSGSVSLDFTRRLIPDQDYDLVKSVPDIAALEAASLHFMQALVWSGEVANRLNQARKEVVRTQRSMDGMLDRHNNLMKQLEEIRAQKDKEKESMLLDLETSRAEAQLSQARALRFEEENKILQAEVERLKGDAEDSWQLGKEKFLKSKEFKILCSGRASVFFEKGFDGCLAQFRANGYSEEEHPALFLDVEQALADMPDDEDPEVELDLYSRLSANNSWASSSELVGLSANESWACVPSWSDLYTHVGGLREKWPVRNWTLSAELVGLMCLHRRATGEVARQSHRLLPASRLSWLRCSRSGGSFHPRRASAELDFECRAVGLMCSCRRATRGVASTELDFDVELVGLMATGEVASAELDFECRAGLAHKFVLTVLSQKCNPRTLDRRP
ncbi:G-box-binding factor 1 [Dorcoceras hygrometricum]|uniref:G-box-binding factor 1 n=1 Tax=Dorcoceras hygrometricum TaxID=472368 RepID=A0A2Z7AIG2_9LAMI|nr:G-box-binding factor 1 [Dorcoceras hygrometricum]